MASLAPSACLAAEFMLMRIAPSTTFHRMKSLRLLLLCPLLVGCTRGVTPRADAMAPESLRRPGAVYSFYEVKGSTADELHAALLRDGPRLEGRSLFGSARSDIVWKAQWVQGLGGCRVTSLDVLLRSTALLPRFRATPEVDSALIARWSAFERALASHEAGHIDFGRAAEQEMRTALGRETAPTCALLEQQMKVEADRVLAKLRQRNQEYDIRTRHGATEGVLWPPRATADR